MYFLMSSKTKILMRNICFVILLLTGWLLPPILLGIFINLTTGVATFFIWSFIYYWTLQIADHFING